MMLAAFTSNSASHLLFATVLCSSSAIGCGDGADEPITPPHARAVAGRPGLQATALLAKTGETVRDFNVLAGGVALVPPHAADAAQTIRVLPSAAGACVSVVHWGDGMHTTLLSGWRSGQSPLK